MGYRKIYSRIRDELSLKTWTHEETETLLKNYNRVTNTELKRLIPNKSPQGIYKKAYKMGIRKSSEIKFKNRSEAHSGEKSPNWNGGKSKNRKGYILVHCPENHRADSKGYVMEHILVWERETGILVPPNCCIHHLNGIKDDNRIENLCLMKFSSHTVFHHLGKHESEETKKKISEKRKIFYAKHRLPNG